eukprot:6210516-Pleurochrysis_carterae.AAC.2
MSAATQAATTVLGPNIPEGLGAAFCSKVSVQGGGVRKLLPRQFRTKLSTDKRSPKWPSS